MIVIICGDRNWTDEDTIDEYIKTLPPKSTIIHGNCRGVDKIAAKLGTIRGHRVIPNSAEWNKYGRWAGPIRNRHMLEEGKPDLVVAFHDDLSQSKGTSDMLGQAEARGIPTEVRRSSTSQNPIRSDE